MAKTIQSVRVVKAGSPPDVDSDIATYARGPLIEHLYENYGRDSVSNIVTFSTLAAKGAFKAMCTIYKIPFVQANRITNLIPKAIEGVECKISDIMDPSSERYAEAGEFREAVSDPKWKPIMDGAKAIEGRVKSTGVHACGVIISSRSLSEVIPLQTRQDDGRTISQWTFPDLEAIGLQKMDLLGLDTVDLIQASIKYIILTGKTPPNMMDLIAGNMDDSKTYEMLRRGETIGLFQLGGDGVQELLKKMQANTFEDIAATTALYRPGPMGMKSHVRYAERKTGREPVTMPHPDFKGTILEEILKPTYGVVVYQETILKIANLIAGMTLAEGDMLRKAMGKKKMSVMLSMKPKFVSGSLANGYSKDAVEKLWDTLASFAKYGFNRSHAVAYGMTAYQTAYLKANYPVEFMAALIAQNVGNKEKILPFIQEAKRMGLKIGAVDVNSSGVRVAPNLNKSLPVDIIYGISGIKSVSESNAAMIVAERTENGFYDSVQNFIDRSIVLGISNKTIFENLALAGAFDSFGVSRKAVVENISKMVDAAKMTSTKGASLFDMFSEDIQDSKVDLSNGEEYSFVEKLKKEADIIGLYLTAHPLDNVGKGFSQVGIVKIGKLMKYQSTTTVTVVGALSSIEKKRNKMGVQIQIYVDDGTGVIRANLNREVVHGISKKASQNRLKKLYCDGAMDARKEIIASALDERFYPFDDIETNMVYSMSITFRPSRDDGQYGARVNWIRPLLLTPEGKLPIRVRVPAIGGVAKARTIIRDLTESLSKLPKGEYPVYLCGYRDLFKTLNENSDISVFKDALSQMEKEEKEGATEKKTREWPPPSLPENIDPDQLEVFRNRSEKADFAIDFLNYKPLGVSVDKNQTAIQIIEDFVGLENYDLGLFDSSVLEK